MRTQISEGSDVFSVQLNSRDLFRIGIADSREIRSIKIFECFTNTSPYEIQIIFSSDPEEEEFFMETMGNGEVSYTTRHEKAELLSRFPTDKSVLIPYSYCETKRTATIALCGMISYSPEWEAPIGTDKFRAAEVAGFADYHEWFIAKEWATKNNESLVFFAKHPYKIEVIKIGFSKDPRRRISEIRRSTGIEFEIIYIAPLRSTKKLASSLLKKNALEEVGPDTFRLYTPNPEGFLCIKESRYKNIRDLLEDMKIE